MKLLATSLVLVTIGLAAEGVPPAIIHHLKRQDIQQFGKCSQDQTKEIFVDYPTQCYSAFDSLKEAFKSDTRNPTIYQDLYSQLCSPQCTDQIETFAQMCEVTEYTEPFLHACDQNAITGDFCLAAHHKNDGAEAATDCYAAIATGRCSESCKTSLEKLQTDLGCCVNSLFNTSTYGMDQIGVAAHELWSLCQMDELPQCSNSLHSLSLSGAPGLQVPLVIISLLTAIQAMLF